MSIIGKIFRKKSQVQEPQESSELRLLRSYEKAIRELLARDEYLARSDYQHVVSRFAEMFAKYKTLSESGTLSFFCDKEGIKLNEAEAFLSGYADLSSIEGSRLVKNHNEKFMASHLVSDKSYLDDILLKVDHSIKLDDDQRRVVLSDEDYTLVIAGAGAGKTTTMAAKVKYLVEKKGISPGQILVISFTNKAVDELRSKINKNLGIECPVTTFHKAGYSIVKGNDSLPRSVADQGFMFNVIRNYLKGNILENPELVDKLILFFGSYFDAPFEGEGLNDFFNYIKKADFSTLKGNIDEYVEEVTDKRTGRRISIAHETLRSEEEVMIANYLFLNGIDYEYEKPYPYYFDSSDKIYTPDFTIEQDGKLAYIEHFGITQDGKNSRYTDEQLVKYKKSVKDKILLHKKHRTDLIYTFSAYNDGRSTLVHLHEELAHHGFELRPRPSREVFDKIVSTEENRYILKLIKLVCTFIQNFKTRGLKLDDFSDFREKAKNERTKLFLTICEQCYLEYEKRLKEKNALDFEDMINESARIVMQEQKKGTRLDYKYIIVDEYQDISRQRFNLTKELSKLCNAKIVAVGDDWQSIYAYAGSEITLFTEFAKTFGYGLKLNITRTYRNAQEIIDIAGGFIQKNSSQIKKALISPKRIDGPVVIQTYTEEVDRKLYQGKGGKFYLIGATVHKIIEEILAEKPDSSILLLGRYGFDAYNLSKSADFTYSEKTRKLYSKSFPKANFDFMTVHRAKGLGYDNVIIINAMDAVYGFPSQIQDDPVLRYVVADDRSYAYAEERRLFYVALTRTKNRVYIVTPQQRPSPFVKELLNDYPEVILRGELDKENKNVSKGQTCPVCGYPLQLRYKKNYGLKLWLCSNEPEVCDFITNDPRGGELSILKCNLCKDGYLIVKKGKDYFLGCTCYRPDRTGCNNVMSKEYYVKKYLNNEEA